MAKRQPKNSCIIRNKKGDCLDDNIVNSWILLFGMVISAIATGIVIAFAYAFIPLNGWTIAGAILVMYLGILIGRVGLRD